MADNSVGHYVEHTSIALGVINTAAVALRILARWRSNAVFAADDALIIASLIPFYAMIAIGHLSQSGLLHLHLFLIDASRC